MTNQLSTEQKATILRSNGWQTLWSDNFWIKNEWLNPARITINWTGLDIDEALDQVLSKLKRS